MAPLETLGFALAGYGCTTCIGNSGPLDAADRRGHRGQRPGRGRRPVGQSQLRGPDPSAGPGELPRLPAAGRRLRPGRPGRHRPDDASRWGPARTDGRSSWPTSGRDPTRSGRSSANRSRPSCSARPTPASSTATTAGGPCRSRPATGTPGIPTRPTSRGRRSSTASASSRRPWRTSTAARVLAVLGDSVTTDHISPAGSIAPSIAGRPLAPGARRAPARVQQLRRPAGPPRGDDARHVRQHPAAQRPRRRARKAHTRSTCPTATRSFIYDAADALRRRRRPAGHPRRPRVRLGLIARLGGQGHGPARRAGRDCPELRADPPLEPGRHGRPAPPVRSGRQRRLAWA